MNKYVIPFCTIVIIICNCGRMHNGQHDKSSDAMADNWHTSLNKPTLAAAPNRSTDTHYIDMLTGFITIVDDDVSTPGLRFRRYYNPMLVAGSYIPIHSERWKNPCGYGWQHSYNIYLRPVEQINSPTDTIKGLVFHVANRLYAYRLLPNGKYKSKRNRHDNLIKSNNGWQLYRSNGDIYYFGSSRKVDSIVDRHGYKTTFTYSGNYLSTLTGKDKSVITLRYDSDSLLRWLSVTTDTSAALIEYRYAPVTMAFEKDTFNLPGIYHLTQVLQHVIIDSVDVPTVLYGYYYEPDMKMVAKTIPRDTHLQSDTVWQNNWKSGDRLYLWYNKFAETIYHEIIEDDGDTLLTNDRITYRAYTEFYRSTSFAGSMDSALWYTYQKDNSAGAAHNPYDASFSPKPPENYRSLEKRDYHADPLGRQIFVERRKPSGERSVTEYYKDRDYNDTMIVLPSNDTLRYFYQNYFLDETTERYSEYPTKMKLSTGDSMLFHYHAPDTNAPSFFVLDSIGGVDFEYRDYFDESNVPDSSRFY